MWEDPVIKEVRKAGEELARKADWDIDKLIRMLRANEKKSKARIVSLEKELMK